MKVEVDQEMCIGCGMCAEIASEIFRMNEEGKAESYADAVDGLEASAQEAIDSCPVAAIAEV
ncbi:MAG: ferredoxin [Lachnospiraceae bacterium]|nr:ferredoxin [Lachnospiraceae bacterium]